MPRMTRSVFLSRDSFPSKGSSPDNLDESFIAKTPMTPALCAVKRRRFPLCVSPTWPRPRPAGCDRIRCTVGLHTSPYLMVSFGGLLRGKVAGSRRHPGDGQLSDLPAQNQPLILLGAHRRHRSVQKKQFPASIWNYERENLCSNHLA